MKIKDIPSSDKLYMRSVVNHAVDTLPKYLKDFKQKVRELDIKPIKEEDSIEIADSKLLKLANLYYELEIDAKTLKDLANDLFDKISKYDKDELVSGLRGKKTAKKSVNKKRK